MLEFVLSWRNWTKRKCILVRISCGSLKKVSNAFIQILFYRSFSSLFVNLFVQLVFGLYESDYRNVIIYPIYGKLVTLASFGRLG